MQNANAILTTNNAGNVAVDRYPDQCPICHHYISPTLVYCIATGKFYPASVRAVYLCPNRDCKELFISYFSGLQGTAFFLRGSRPVEPEALALSASILEISPSYCAINEEAHKAEQAGLTQICGVGYRKALEFLIKDYLIRKLPDDKENIVKVALGACIENYVDNPRIKALAKRATWLGNDETHYMRIWIDKDLSDLKLMIQAVVSWMEMEHFADAALESMPEKR